ncbi:trehalose/maltose hydrolase or phosphorylase [Sphaerochaeta pleomorpha str. Grapes]|uniref:Trehalose/maltose hydrolase or phosphorylase n=1 Tax=Sphaerochaeta pleomorpha (strain ATCC BAA-1885 / DSM 22778 / Grapes) TaxID=158190 RepID=G8QRE8_SPHPG|nr:glycosyl hydrolase family 65 protein [Sphaerochaeta pleomorpha]AEV28801.1 trehalose/maltose hydrolase or phosphorylase [Sphaerochaeta pleomorpha str. Grapes]
MPRGKLHYHQWSIETDFWSMENKSFFESIFFQGNGAMGRRAVFCGDSYTPATHGLFKAGVFDYVKPGITDLVNLPDPLLVAIEIDGHICTSQSDLQDFKQTLDLKTGLVSRTWQELGVRITVERFFSFDDTSLCAERIIVEAQEKPVSLCVSHSLDGTVANLPIHDDQTIKNEQMLYLLKNVEVQAFQSFRTLEATTNTGLFHCLYFASDHCSVPSTKQEFLQGAKVKVSHSLLLEKGKTVSFEFIVSVSTKPVCFSAKEKEAQARTFIQNSERGFSFLFARSKEFLLRLWDDCDISIEGPEADQCAIRFAIFELLQNCSAQDASVSIGARGLSHGRYKGCYFWDTEVFMFPFYLYCYPEAAKSLLDYRLHTLGAAKENALKHNAEGARYPWMCSLDGSEQCESWDIGKCEIHVTADIAWAMGEYARVQGQEAWEREEAATLYIETARFWASRFTYEKATDRYELLFVKGPDEYAGVTKNNTFTVTMAKYNLQLALDILKKGATLKNGTAYPSLQERSLWKQIIEKARVPYDALKGTFAQDDTFSLLEPVALSDLKHNDEPLYHSICFDRLQRYQILKQPDVILLSTMLPSVFTKEQKQAAWHWYEPITAHDSTLSWGMHALCAFQIGEMEKAEKYLTKSMFLDLEDLMGNTASEGLHIGSYGASWQAIVLGCAQLMADSKGAVTLDARLPLGWKGLHFTVQVHGHRYRIDITGNEVSLVGKDTR